MDHTWKTEKFKKLPKARQAEITKRVKQGANSANLRRIQLNKRSAFLKAGRKYVATHDVAFSTMKLGDYTALIGMKVDVIRCTARIAYAVCSPNDQFSMRTGRGIIGQRLQKSYIEIGPDLAPFNFSNIAIRTKVLIDILSYPKTPKRLLKKITQ